MDQHVLGGLDPTQLDVERDEIRARHRGARHDPLTLELSRAHVQRLEPPRAIGLAVGFVHGRLVRAVGRHVVPIRGPGPPFKARAPSALV